MSDDLRQLMLEYSRRGIGEWSQAGPDLRKKAKECVGYDVTEDEGETEWAISDRRTVKKFIPMPRRGYKGKGFEWCFFLPQKANGNLMSLALFIVVNRARKDCLAFRFEGHSRGPHSYSHVQLTSKMPGQSASNTRLLEWIPDSYPAFPIPARNRTEMFLAMMTAVHGYCGGADILVRDIFMKAGRPDYIQKYLGKLKNMLFKLD